MPLTFVSGQLVQFAHVPRCGGSSIENYLHGRFGRLAFLDRRDGRIPSSERWSHTSPQHIETVAFDRIIPDAWIAHRFALVRHPEDRIISVFLFQRDIEQAIPHEMRFSEWIASLPSRIATNPHYLDNHVRPADELVPRQAVPFKLENGMEQVIEWLDGIEGAQRGARKIGEVNSYAARLQRAGRDPGQPLEITPQERAVITETYAADFERFGYVPRTDGPTKTAATASKGDQA
ncbi:sulfotransferase family 2 domain-containing protein [Roseovarius salis]|uniref:sulfotransferase family 2 domain-containing protein n=1 Tax=Roseovarius salis TaxID=3376063 RepID=UPI0037C6660A